MRKKLLLKKLLAVFMLLGIVSPTWADKITGIGTAITDLSALTPGTKVLFYHQHTGNDGTRQYYLYDNNGTISQNATIPSVNEEGSAKYAWTVSTVIEDGQTFYKFRSSTGKYINFVNGEDFKTLKTTGSKFFIQKDNDGENDHWNIKDTETTNDNCWFNGDPISSTAGFNTWPSGSPYEIIPVTTDGAEGVTVTVTGKNPQGNIFSTCNDVVETGTEHAIKEYMSQKEYNTISGITVNGAPTDMDASITVSAETTIEYTRTYIIPFESSNIQSDNFPKETKWYLLGISGTANDGKKPKYLQYLANQDYINLNETSQNTDAFLWAFNTKEDGTIEIFNRLAGANKKLSSEAPEIDLSASTTIDGQNTHPIMRTSQEITDGGYTSAWDITQSTLASGKNGFFLDRAGEETYCLNDRNNKLAYWTQDKDLGSTFWVVPCVNYTIKCVDENGTELQIVTGYGAEGTAITLPSIDNSLTPASATYNDQPLSLESNNTQITLPENYDGVITVTYTDFFRTSTKPTGSTFAEDTHWYYLKINSGTSNNESLTRYAAYTEKDNDENEIDLFASNPINYGSFWAFVKTDDGKIQIYNAAAGTSKVLTIGSTKETGTQEIRTLKMEDATSATANNSWDKELSTRDSYLLLKATVDSKIFYINHAYATTTNNESKPNNVMFVKQTAKGEWSDLMFEPVDIAAVAQTTRENEGATYLGCVGNLNQDEYNAFTAALDKNTVEGLVEALKIKDNTDSRITFEPNKFYRLMTPGSTDNNYMTVTDAGAKGQTLSDTDASQIWKFSGDATSGYKLSAQGRYMLTPTTNAEGNHGEDVGNTTNAEEGASFFMLNSSTTLFNIGTTKDDLKNKLSLSGDTDHPIIGWGRYIDASKWYIIPATTIKIAISQVGYSTAKYPFAVALPEGIKAYTGTVTNDESNKVFLLNEVSEGKIPAGTPVVLEGTAGQTYPLTIDSENTNDPITPNDLTGTLLPEAIAEGTTIYGLSQYEGVVGFYKLADDATNRTVSANKAYLPGTPATQGVRGLAFSFSDNDGTTTGIENTVTETGKEEYYDLHGRRVMNPNHGIYITKSGKKVFFAK